MRKLRYLATTLLLCVGFLVPADGFSQGRGNRSEHRTTQNSHRGGQHRSSDRSSRGGYTRTENRGGSILRRNPGNRGKDNKITINRNRERVSRTHERVNKNYLGDRNSNRRGQVHADPPRRDRHHNPGLRHERRPVVRHHAGYRPSYVGRRHGGWGRPLPPPPMRPPRRHYYRAPLIDFGLGLVYGSLLNTGLNTLINAGLNVAATVNNAIYLSNVMRYGVTWPQVTMYYNSGSLSGARYQYGSPYTNYSVYDDVYNQLVRAYGQPLNIDYDGVSRTATWWGGGNSGYVTLSFSPGYNDYGETIYYTDLLYGQ